MTSPWRAVLGTRFDQLHPRLRAYFDEIPHGSVGSGEGEFETVGTPRWWARAAIRLAAHVDADVLFPVWERSVSFTVTNFPTSVAGRPAVRAERVFRFASGDCVMNDLIVATAGGLVDILGAHRRFRALFDAQVVDGGLALTSTRVAFRIGTTHLVIPRCFAPRVGLSERFSDVDGLQHIALAMRVPLIGKVYEYAGAFRYNITSEAA